MVKVRGVKEKAVNGVAVNGDFLETFGTEGS